MVHIDVSPDGVTYRCALPCPYHKKCFILKTLAPIHGKLVVLQKCAANKKRDIPLTIQAE